MTPMPSRPHPDPSRGVFETMLVVRGVPIASEAHLERLEVSLEAVYGMELPGDTRQTVADRAKGLGLGRVRLTFAPHISEIEVGEVDPDLHFPDCPVSLRSQRVPGGLGSHKWADRRALPASTPSTAALLVDGADVLEADRANVFAIRNGALFTPSLDGRILPGVTRATTIALAHGEGLDVTEGALDRGWLGEADEVFLTNSVRGIEPVDTIDEVRLSHERPVTRQLARALQDGWQNEAAARRRPLRTSV
jgi:para-aminobenzoate synthetase/4-amino-4-deoxychorismate lyase